MGVQTDYAEYISHHLFQKLWLNHLGFCDISGLCKIMQVLDAVRVIVDQHPRRHLLFGYLGTVFWIEKLL
ncbi:hypothetical protein VNO77_33965 [Canavalia gladiata]|uniref:Uncharacterized protein n=1 Tax=Canavalia gladiata TaxID=3824 RepID=A0AAN9KED0_CANGL